MLTLILGNIKRCQTQIYFNPELITDYCPSSGHFTSLATNEDGESIYYTLEGESPLRSYLDAAVVRGAQLDPFADTQPCKICGLRKSAKAPESTTIGAPHPDGCGDELRESPSTPTTQFKL